MPASEALLTPGHKAVPDGGVALSTIVVPVRAHLLPLLTRGRSTLRSNQGGLDRYQALGSLPPNGWRRIRPRPMTTLH